MDPLNPAVEAHTNVPPALLELVEKDSREISKVARKMLLVQIDAAHRLLRDPTLPMGLRLQFMELLAKIGDVFVKASSQPPPGSGFNVNIILSEPAPKPAIKASAPEVLDVEVKSAEHANVDA